MIKWILSAAIILALFAIPGCTPPKPNPPRIETAASTPMPTPIPQPSTPIHKPQAATPPSVLNWNSIKGKVVVIDPGHGGKDPGTMGDGLRTAAEKDLNLMIAKELAQQLKSRGAKVVLTRASDSFVELDDRALVAEKYKADLFVAIHVNSNPDSSRTGTVVYTSREPSQRSRWAAIAINWALTGSGIESCTDEGNYKVLVLHGKPAVLIECGYLTNFADCKRLNTSSYRSKLAGAIANGVGNYFAKHG